MRDFFRVMGRAFAIVFGSTSALALVYVLFGLALRPLLRSMQRSASQVSVSAPPVPKPPLPPGYYDGDAAVHVGSGKGFTSVRPIVLVNKCSEAGCELNDTQGNAIAWIPRGEINKANWVDVDKH